MSVFDNDTLDPAAPLGAERGDRFGHGKVGVPDREELVKRAAALRPDLWDHAPACDHQRRVLEPEMAAIVDSGLTRLMTPRRLGGYQTDMRTLLDVTTELGRGCSSAAWVTSVLNAGNFTISLFSEIAQEEVWAGKPNSVAALVLGMPARDVEGVDAGVIVSGQWAYASGCLHADWIGVLVLVQAPSQPPAPYLALLKSDQISITDSWFFAGMRGTGSNTVVAQRAFIPEHRLLPYQPVLDGETDGLVDDGHVYRNSLTGLFMIGLTGALIGGAEAAFRYVREQAFSRPVAGSTYRAQVDSPTLQVDLAEAAMRIDNASMHARRIADTVDQFAQAGQNTDLETRARARMAATYAGQQCREALDILLTAYGTSAFNEQNPLQRIWRDINVGSRHAGFGMGIPQQVYGRALVGRDPRDISPMV